jgi:hypothetical protein
MNLDFVLMVDSSLGLGEVSEVIRNICGATAGHSQAWLETESNWVQIRRNDDYDPELALSQEDGFFHYRYRVEVAPKPGETNLENQIAFAVLLRLGSEERGCRVAVCADFEGLL